MYRITYKTQSVKDTTKLDEHHHYIYGNDEMRLDIGRHLNRFYNYTKEKYDSLLRASGIDAGGVVRVSSSPMGTISWCVSELSRGSDFVFRQRSHI